MTFSRLLLRNLLYHRRGNFAVLLGVALGTAVLTGALLVGDSLQGSLRELMLDRLGWVEEALVPGRFFRSRLFEDIAARLILASAANFDVVFFEDDIHAALRPQQPRRESEEKQSEQ